MKVAIHFVITSRHIIDSVLGFMLILFDCADYGAIISSLSDRIRLTLTLIVTISAFVDERKRRGWQRAH